MKSFLRVSMAVGRVTLSEILRDKVLYNIFLFALLLFGVSFAASQLTFLTPERVVLDFGFSAINISCAMVAILNGSAMLAKEFDRRTIFVALARPITRLQFVGGKFFGLCGIVFLNWLMLSTLETTLYFYLGGVWSATYGLALIFILLQSFVLAALSVFFSSFVTTSLSVVILVGLYLIGNNVSGIQTLLSKLEPGLVRSAIQWGSYFIPNFEYFNLGFKVTYSLPIGLGFASMSVGYGLLLIVLSLLGAGKLLQGRET
jgi:Cu-processing system permease protein